MQAKLVLAAALLATVLLYWIGLHGPFLLDDLPNLGSTQAWAQGQATWQEVVFSNDAGALGRSLSMASFLLSTALGGFNPFAFKLGNLVIHLACGLLGWQVLRRALARDQHLSGSADLIASLLAALWLLHPINVSTVLYAVQRMAQLSTFFVLASLWAYFSARQQLATGQLRRAWLGLFVLFPLLLVTGLLSKENAAVAPALCLVLELAYFTRQPRPGRMLPAFFGLFVALPAIAVSALLLFKPARLLGAYAGRDFSLLERLLTQPLVLMDYIGLLLVPRNPLLGIINDDFVASTGLFSPPSTVIAILALLAISGFAVAMRKRAPSIFAGWFFFLVAHSVESTFLPLELYFEHRNYLPAFGFWLAVAGTCELATRNLRTNVLSRRQLGLLAAGGFALAFSFSTMGRAHVWANEDTIYAQTIKMHPTSSRANLAAIEIAVRQNDYQQSLAALSRLLASNNPRDRMLGHIHRVSVDCIFGLGANPDELRAAIKEAQPVLTLAEMQGFEVLDSYAKAPISKCGAVTPNLIASTIDSIVNAADAQSDDAEQKWRLRYLAATLYGRADDWTAALVQAKQAWQPSAAPVVGAFLARSYAHNGLRKEAESTYKQAVDRSSPYNMRDQMGLTELRSFLDAYAEKRLPSEASAETK
jgi:hypothetical protein